MQYADARCTYTERFKPQHVYVFEGPYLDKPQFTRQVTVKAEELFKYRRGAMIQDAFPNLSADDREFLMSGLSPYAFAQLAEPDPQDIESLEHPMAGKLDPEKDFDELS